MSGPRGERCEDCYFAERWEDDTEEDPFFCRRYPPSITPEDDYKDTPMPITVGHETWCGEFKPRLLEQKGIAA